jgi:hypothetical protein
MDTTTLLIIIIVVLILFGGGWYGRGLPAGPLTKTPVKYPAGSTAKTFSSAPR